MTPPDTTAILLPRTALTEDLWNNANIARLYWLLLAKSDENGIAAISLREIAAQTRMTLKEVRTALDKLCQTQKTARKEARIIVCEINTSSTSRAQHTAQKKAQKKSPPAQQQLVLVQQDTAPHTFVDPMFADAFTVWLDYKKEQFKFKYRSERSLKAAYNELVRLSGYNPCTAMRIVEQSMARGWKGLFKLQENDTQQTHSTFNTNRNSCQALADRADELLQLFASADD